MVVMRIAATLPADVASPRLARRWLDDHLPASVAQSLRDSTALLVSELVTNAVVHAMTPCTITVDITDGGIRVAVADGAPEGPAVPAAYPAESGRGIIVVARLADRWGWRPTAGGKEVWFELLPGRETGAT
jgi:anti-sigma regulatory factor (Ser/Thr protein kinase)